jgi:putative ABC transport system substrate-binding protein
MMSCTNPSEQGDKLGTVQAFDADWRAAIIAGKPNDRKSRMHEANHLGSATTAVEGKRLEFLRELVPNAETLGYLTNPSLSGTEDSIREVELEAQTLGVKLRVLKAGDEPEIDNAFATVAKERIGGITVAADPFFFTEREQLVALAERNAVPTIYFFPEFTLAGGLVSYGTNLADAYRYLADYTARILAGVRPADLPITELSEKIELVVNLKTARALGLAIPQPILGRATEVIE